MRKACLNGRFRIVELLLKYKAHINSPYETIQLKSYSNIIIPPLIAATQNNHVDIVKLLLDQGQNINIDIRDANNMTALLHATVNGNLPLVQWFLDKGANPNCKATYQNKTVCPLFIALELHHKELIDTFIKTADIDINIYLGWPCETILEKAIISRHIHVATKLLEAGSNPNIRKLNGSAILHELNRYAQHDIQNIVDMLVKYGADTEALNTLHQTPLHVYISNKSDTSILALLLHNCDVNTSQHTNALPIIWALQNFHIKSPVISMLVLVGCYIQPAIAMATKGLLLNIIWNNKVKSKDLECFTEIQNLKHMCRLRIRQLLGRPFYKKLDMLTCLPRIIKDYVSFCELRNRKNYLQLGI